MSNECQALFDDLRSARLCAGAGYTRVELLSFIA